MKWNSDARESWYINPKIFFFGKYQCLENLYYAAHSTVTNKCGLKCVWRKMEIFQNSIGAGPNDINSSLLKVLNLQCRNIFVTYYISIISSKFFVNFFAKNEPRFFMSFLFFEVFSIVIVKYLVNKNLRRKFETA